MALVAIFLLLLLVVVIGHRRKKRNSGLLTNWPVAGMMPELLENITRIHDFATDVLKNSGGTFEFKGPWFANHHFLVTNDPINVHHILNASFANYPKGPDFKKIFEPFGDGIINSESDLWKNQRRMYQTLIGQSKYEPFIEKTILGKVVDGLIPVLDHVSKSSIQVYYIHI